MNKRNNILAWFEHILEMEDEDMRVLAEFYQNQPQSDFMVALASIMALADD